MKKMLLLGIVVTVMAGVTGRGQTTSEQNSTRVTTASNVQADLRVDDSRVLPSYANFVRVSGSPEELILDFGLNKNPVGPPKEPIVVGQRVILNYYSAKRLYGALQLAIERHEKLFGTIETDIEKRIKNDK